ncbi:SDR family oxidoreductase [Streptomyces durbertensis]|uniref:SDR family oxidoreductase n=1 Tax=Streptomyces durbertensis TaxID=2448886 RepID=A0ABR6EAQ3_9ACTN|nr:SDR family oxidoreductase [Streptomyces durbertensis]MBB1242333.1 SDR family oxidoreductase [Streptomyces durbertensis]
MTRTVVISGGGTGIGLAAARRFAADGDQLVLVGRRPHVLEEALAELPGAAAVAADLTTPEGAERVENYLRVEFGAVDVLVNAAGGNGGLEDAAEPARDGGLGAVAHDWTLNFRLNVLTSVLLTDALSHRLACPGGRVLFLGSISALRGSGSCAYAAAKAALHPYAFDLARRLGPHGVTVNVVAPGYVEDTGFFGDSMTEERHRELVAETFTGRAGRPGDVAETLHWLASHAAGHVTGQIIQVNGGAFLGR